MAISSIGVVGSNVPDISKLTDRVFKKADTNNDGSIDRSELATSLKSTTQSESGSGASSADKLFQKADGNNDGEISKDELKSALTDTADKAQQKSPPAGGGAPQGAGKSGSSSSSSSSNKVYDKKDTNEDGTVSVEEELAYNLKHPEEARQKAIDQKVTGTAPYERVGESIDTKV